MSGSVYRDLPVSGTGLNTYGVKDTNEFGVEGVMVMVTDSTGAIVGSPTQTDASGAWSVNGTSGDVRVEFSNIPAYLASSPVNNDSNTTVQFIADGGTANLGLHDPADFNNQDYDELRIANLVSRNGDPLGGGNTATQNAFQTYLYNSQGYGPNDVTTLAKAEDIGSVWGVAYQKETKTLFTSAFMRRHSGFGPLGPGGIYSIDADTGTVSQWLDIYTLTGVTNTADPRANEALPNNISAPNRDAAAFPLVGKMSLGDIDISPDGQYLYVMNLADRAVLKLDIANKSLVETYNITDPGCSDAADMRPWAISLYRQQLYVGVVCTAESTQSAADLKGYVLRLSGNAFNSVLNFPLNYSRGCSHGYYTGTGMDANCTGVGDFLPWTAVWNDKDTSSRVVMPQAILADIEFDPQGNMILGIADRGGFQVGNFNWEPTGTDTTTHQGNSAGEILFAAGNPTTGWTFENNGQVAGLTGGPGTGEGPGGGEFFWDDAWSIAGMPPSTNSRLAGAAHAETSLGGLALLAGDGHVLSAAYDPRNGDEDVLGNNFDQNGVRWLSLTDGSKQRGFTTLPTGTAFSKAGSMGDIELMTAPAPLEIGNRVWDDANSNGLQDAGEAGIDGVEITLNCGGADFTQTTANGGLYLFTDSNVTGGIPRHTACTITVPTTVNSKVLTAQLSQADEPLGSNPASASGSFSFTTGASGQNNHTYDIGYRAASDCTPILNAARIINLSESDTNLSNNSAMALTESCVTADPEVDLGLSKTANTSQGQPGDNVVFTLVVSNKGPDDASGVVVTDSLPAGLSFVSATGGDSHSESNGTVTWNMASVAANASVTLTVTASID